ncbi:MAG: hypothetical protein ACYYKD_01900 [Rhodospirillales bacterium]
MLRTSADLPPPGAYARWFAVTDTQAALAPETRAPDIAEHLDRGFLNMREDWWSLARTLQKDPGGECAHMPTCGAMGSDFGLMLAWEAVVSDLMRDEGETALCICDDPWLFRHLAECEGVSAGRAPGLFWPVLKLIVRGLLARAALALRSAWAALTLAPQRMVFTGGDSVLLVYGHPESDAAGHDAYFADMMLRFPEVKRLLHTDCPPARVRELAADGRTAGLHAWGSVIFALGALFFLWRPRAEGPRRWLIIRAAARENSGGGPAINRWQQHCQARFLAAARPKTVLWPWENHGWERAFCRAARALGVRTAGCQHTAIGPYQINYAVHANHDGPAAFPDVIAANGPACAEELRAWGAPKDRIVDAGCLRIPPMDPVCYAPSAPVLVLLPAVRAAAPAMLSAARALADDGWTVLVKAHPMYDVAVPESGNLKRTEMRLRDFESLAGVIYSMGVSGLEARFAGVPVLRVLFEDRAAIDSTPARFDIPSARATEIAERFRSLKPPPPVRWHDVFSDPDFDVWRRLIAGEKVVPECPA